MKINFGNVKLKKKINIGNFRLGVKIIGDVAEDLTAELKEQDNLLNTQEITIENIITALEGKSAGGSGITPIVEGNILILSHANIEGGVLSI